MGVEYQKIIERMMASISADSETELATDIEISPQTLNNAKKTGTVPPKYLILFWEKHPDISLDWILTGEGTTKRLATSYMFADEFKPAGASNEPDEPFTVLPEINIRFLSLPALLDMTDEYFCNQIEMNPTLMDQIKGGCPVPGLVMRAVAYQFNVRMRWLKMGEEPWQLNLSGRAGVGYADMTPAVAAQMVSEIRSKHRQ